MNREYAKGWRECNSGKIWDAVAEDFIAWSQEYRAKPAPWLSPEPETPALCACRELLTDDEIRDNLTA